MSGDAVGKLTLEACGREIADQIASSLPEGTGFALFVFDYGEPGDPGHVAFYLSTAQRDDIRRLLKDWLDRNLQGRPRSSDKDAS